MIKLYNNSKLSNEIILPILKQAYELAEIKGKIVVIITRGYAGGGRFFDSKNLQYKRYFGSKRFIKSDAGFVIINPHLRGCYDPIENASYTCQTILHEFKHASDYIEGIPFTYDKKYSKRPHEVRARIFAKYDAKIDDDLILNLAIEIDKIKEVKK